MFPILSLAYVIAPNSNFGKVIRNPTVKISCWLASEIVFFGLLLSNTLLSNHNWFSQMDAVS